MLDLDSHLSVSYRAQLALLHYDVLSFTWLDLYSHSSVFSGLDSHLILLGSYWVVALTMTPVCSLLGMIHSHTPSSFLGFAIYLIVLVLHIPKTPFLVFIFYSMLNYPMFYWFIFLDMCIVFIHSICGLLDGQQHQSYQHPCSHFYQLQLPSSSI